MYDFPFDLVYMDVWGPFFVPTSDGHIYFLTLVDDATRATWPFLMKAKFEVKALIVSFYNTVLTHFNVKIKCFSSDNALEFKLSNFYFAHSIIHQTSYVYTPQQNSAVERKHQHILSTARALQIQYNLPLSFWGDCVLIAAHLINRLPSSALGFISPWEMVNSVSPPLSALRTFGCACYPYLRPYNKHKLQPRSVKCVFLRYPPLSKGYLCLEQNIHYLLCLIQ